MCFYRDFKHPILGTPIIIIFEDIKIYDCICLKCPQRACLNLIATEQPGILLAP